MLDVARQWADKIKKLSAEQKISITAGDFDKVIEPLIKTADEYHNLMDLEDWKTLAHALDLVRDGSSYDHDQLEQTNYAFTVLMTKLTTSGLATKEKDLNSRWEDGEFDFIDNDEEVDDDWHSDDDLPF